MRCHFIWSWAVHVNISVNNLKTTMSWITTWTVLPKRWAKHTYPTGNTQSLWKHSRFITWFAWPGYNSSLSYEFDETMHWSLTWTYSLLGLFLSLLLKSYCSHFALPLWISCLLQIWCFEKILEGERHTWWTLVRVLRANMFCPIRDDLLMSIFVDSQRLPRVARQHWVPPPSLPLHAPTPHNSLQIPTPPLPTNSSSAAQCCHTILQWAGENGFQTLFCFQLHCYSMQNNFDETVWIVIKAPLHICLSFLSSHTVFPYSTPPHSHTPPCSHSLLSSERYDNAFTASPPSLSRNA